MATTMIALVGGQPLPNLIPIRYYQIHGLDSVLFVYTKGTKKIYDNLQQVLQEDVKVYGVETDPYDIITITQTINDKIDELQAQGNSNLVFNLTGGTKPMSLAAYRVAQQHDAQWVYLQSENKKSLLHCYTWKDSQVGLLSSIVLPSSVTLKDFFDVSFGRDAWRKNVPSSPPGSHFEKALANALSPSFSTVDEVMVGVRTSLTTKTGREQIDLDIVVRLDDQVGIIEAKTSGKKTLDGVKQLSNAMRFLSTYTRQFYVVSKDFEPSEEQKPVFQRLEIEVISLPNYTVPEETLSPDEADKLVKAVEKALKG